MIFRQVSGAQFATIASREMWGNWIELDFVIFSIGLQQSVLSEHNFYGFIAIYSNFFQSKSLSGELIAIATSENSSLLLFAWFAATYGEINIKIHCTMIFCEFYESTRTNNIKYKI